MFLTVRNDCSQSRLASGSAVLGIAAMQFFLCTFRSPFIWLILSYAVLQFVLAALHSSMEDRLQL